MTEKPEKFKKCVQKCLRYHILAINKLVEDGMIFWEYGNGLQTEASRAGNLFCFLFWKESNLWTTVYGSSSKLSKDIYHQNILDNFMLLILYHSIFNILSSIALSLKMNLPKVQIIILALSLQRLTHERLRLHRNISYPFVCFHDKIFGATRAWDLICPSVNIGADIQKPGAPAGVFRYPMYGKDILGWANLNFGII